MAVIPPWLNTNPSDFVKAMQMGASAGLQVAGLRQRGNIASAQMAQNAADREAARADAMERSAESLAFQRWSQEQQGRRAAAALAQQGQIAQAGVNQRGLEATLRARDAAARQAMTADRNRRLDETSAARVALDQAKLEETMRHAKVMEGAAAEKVKRDLDLPSRIKPYKSGSNIVGVDEVTGEVSMLYSAPEESRGVTASGVPISQTEKLGFFSGPAESPLIQSRLGTNGIPPIAVSPEAPAPSGAVTRYVFDRETGKFVPKE